MIEVAESRNETLMTYLDRANEVRSHQAELKRQLAAQEITVAAILDDEIGSGMRLGDVLECLPAHRKPKQHSSKCPVLAGRILLRAGLSTEDQVADLGETERHRLLGALAERGF